MLSRVTTFAAALLLVAATPVLAQEAAPAQTRPSISIEGPGPNAFANKQEEKDAADLAAAIADINRKGYPGIREHRRDLETILKHAPASYPKTDIRGAEVYIRADSREEYMVLAVLGGALAGAARNAEGKPAGETHVFQALNVYPQASLLLGSLANETRDYKEAIKVLDQGLAFQPLNAALTAERNASLMQLKRFAEVLTSVDAVLANALSPPGADVHARLLRNKGYALGELNRLDEAEAAYKDSLNLAPNHPTALNELNYLARLKRGAKPTNGQLITTPPADDAPTPAPAPDELGRQLLPPVSPSSGR